MFGAERRVLRFPEREIARAYGRAVCRAITARKACGGCSRRRVRRGGQIFRAGELRRVDETAFGSRLAHRKFFKPLGNTPRALRGKGQND